MAASYQVIDRRAPRHAVDTGIRQVAEQVAADARARTPVRTGRLAQGWRVEASRRNPASYVVTNNVYYARFVEFGTRRRPAHPMIGPALAAFRARGAR
jgi:HK97 gp10 family phage protein